MTFWLYIIGFAIVGVPTVGFIVKQMIRFGKWVYREYPFVRSFFDNYADHYAIGLGITIVAAIVYIVARWLGWV